MPTIATLSGTSRPDNYTARALAALHLELRAIGLEVDAQDGRELVLGFPGETETADARRLQASFRAADGIVLATPEYHGSFAAWTKLAIENLGFPSALKGKPVALMGVAQGRIGAIKSLEQLRSVAAHTGAVVLPGSLSLAGVRGMFDAEGRLTDVEARRQLAGFAAALRDFLQDVALPKRELEALVREEAGPAWASRV